MYRKLKNTKIKYSYGVFNVTNKKGNAYDFKNLL